MAKENKTKKKSKDAEKSCCTDSDNCSTDCCPGSKKKESKCNCEGCC